MKIWICNATLVAAMALTGAAQAESWGEVCSLETLHGAYSFSISGQILEGPGTGPVNGVALTTFDSRGGLRQTDFVVKNGAPGGPKDAFRTGETGTYTVNADCTGSATINFPDATPAQQLVLMFVVADHGRQIRTVVSALYVGPGIGTMTPTPAQISSEATKL
ncbi:MAG TPA: hypothetical protein VGE92_05640 [Steroidobacteraceae bacterium]|jgi:hypothetical protein